MIISFWNVDYVDALDLYPLKSINRMENEFLSLCDFNLFVSAEMYTKYYMAVREISNPIYQVNTNQTFSPNKTFNRFKTQELTNQSANKLVRLENQQPAKTHQSTEQ